MFSFHIQGGGDKEPLRRRLAHEAAPWRDLGDVQTAALRNNLEVSFGAPIVFHWEGNVQTSRALAVVCDVTANGACGPHALQQGLIASNFEGERQPDREK